MVKIPEILIKRLQGLGSHFCLVKPRSKDPSIGGKGWQKPEKLMFSDDPRLREHLKRGGNYGVVGGFGLVILDADIPEIKRLVEEKLPSTFTVESPGSRGWHCYFLCGLEKPIRLRDKVGENVGDIQGPGKMVVGPGSIHVNGGVYRIVKDLPLAQVAGEQLIEALKPYVVPDSEIQRVEATARDEKRETDIHLSILQVVPLAGLKKQGDQYFGPHPVHGSKTGRNFWVNPAKNVWHCFRHGTGGGPFSWLAVEEGLIDCEDATPGALRGPVFKKVSQKAVERGLVDESEVETKKKKSKEAFQKEEDQTLVDKLITIALNSGIQLFEDDRGEAYARLEGGGHHEIHRVVGRAFERWLRKKYFEVEQKGLRKETLNDASATLAAIAQFQKPSVKRKLYNRVAWHDNSIYYDLADEKWRAIEISANGWEIVDYPPPLFRRFRHQRPQAEPSEDGSLNELFNFINVTDPKDQLLVKVYLVVMLVPDIPHPILLVLGPQGCGKSDLMRALRNLVDPSAVLLQSFRYDELEMALKAFHHYVVYFDNLSSIKQWLSDILCRACTGQGFTKRRLYTDEESVILQFQRCLGVNGIALSQLSPDFLDRCLTLTLKQIPSEKRKHERELWKEFERAKPRIFGAMLNALSKAMDGFPTLEIKHLPRMADFAMWGEAVARALGYQQGEFLEAYREKIGEQVRDVLEENPIGLAIMAFMETRGQWEGSPGELLKELEDEDFVKAHNIDVNDDKWPKSASWVTRRIKEVEANLEHEGIKFSTRREKRRRIITLTKTTIEASKRLTLQEKMKLVYDKARELATDSTVSKFKVADSLKERLKRNEVFDLLKKLSEEGKLAPKGIESYLVVGE